MKNFVLAGAAVVMIVGCGGGGGGGSNQSSSQTPATPAPSTTIPEGLYLGTSNTGRTITGLVLDDGSYYFLYSSPNNTAYLGGVIQGTGVALNGTFTSTNGLDINLEGNGNLATTISASYALGASLSGTVNYPSQSFTSTFTSTYSKDYEITPSLSTIAGTYTGFAASANTLEQTTVTVSSTGAITGKDVVGCSLTGSVSPRSKGNAYNVTITFGGPPCLISGGAFTGIGYFDPTQKRLYAAVLNAGRTTGFVFNGVKP